MRTLSASGAHRRQPSPRRRQQPVLEIPRSLARSRLMQQGGFAVYDGLLDAALVQQLLAEAVALSEWAVASNVCACTDEQQRGGAPARRFLNGSGGPVQRAMYRAPATLAFLRSLTHPSLEPTGDLGTYSYYVRPGDHLALHRDIVTCDVAVITCLSDRPASARGGALVLYPDRYREPLSAIRATPAEGARHVRLREGHTIVFYGGIVPHELLPVDPGQARIVSVLCYEVKEAGRVSPQE